MADGNQRAGFCPVELDKVSKRATMEALLQVVRPHVGILEPVVPLLKLLSMSLIGSVLAHPRIDVISQEAFNLLSKLVFALFLPCLIFTELGKSFNLQNMREWWFIPVNVLLNSIIGCILGYCVAVICRPPPQFFRFTIVMTGIGNTGNLPLAIVGSICRGRNNSFGASCYRNGVAYVGYAQWIAVIIVYTFVYHMLEPPEEFYELVTVGEEIEREEEPMGAGTMPLLLEAEWPGVKAAQTADSRTPLLFRKMSISEDAATAGGDAGDDSRVQCLTEPKVVRKMRIVAEKTPIKHILQPPTVASLLGIVVGLLPHLSEALFTEDAPLSFFTDSLTILAAALVPCIMLVLGGLLAGGPVKSELGLRTLIGICFTRLVLLPAVGIGVVLLAGKLGFLQEEGKMFRFILLLQYAMPSAILLGAMTSLRGYGQREASALLFWQHIFAVFSLAFYISVFFNIVEYI